jgi:hypothetical protein
MILGRVRDVLPTSLPPVAVKNDHRGDACKAARDWSLATFQLVALHIERQIGKMRIKSLGRGPSC